METTQAGLPASDGTANGPRNDGPVIDWLSVTLPMERLGLAADLAGGLDLRPAGYLSFDTSATGGRGAIIAWNEGAGKGKATGVHLILSSKVLHLLGAEGRCPHGRGLLRELVDAGAKTTRIDVALDDYSGLVTTRRAYRHLCRGHFVSRFGRLSRHQSAKLRGGTGLLGTRGDTLYIGSVQSETFFRIYDKAAEAQVPGPWTRCEVQWRGKRAHEISRRIATGESPVGYVRGMLEFKDSQSAKSVTRIKRALPAAWWLDFLRGQESARLSLPKDARSLEQVKGWLEHQVSGALQLVNTTLGRGEIERIVEKGKRPLSRNREYLRIVAEHEAARKAK